MKLTTGMRALMIAMGCDPPLCHACGLEFVLDGEISIHTTGQMVHLGCHDVLESDMKIVIDPALKARVSEELKNLSLLPNPVKAVEDGWRSPVRTRGSYLSADDMKRLGAL